MIKKLSVIKLGRYELCHETYCIYTWTKCYPDFEYNLINEDTILPDGRSVIDWINDCPLISKLYNSGKVVYAVDYIRLVVGYLIGGVIVDTDVICNNKIPEWYFDKYDWMMPVDNAVGSTVINNGAFQYSVPRLSIFKEFIDLYRSFEDGELDIYNDCITKIILKYVEAVNYNQNTEVPKDNGCVLNALEFGGWDYSMNKILPREMNKYHKDMNDPYVIHCNAVTWRSPKFDNLIPILINNQDDLPDAVPKNAILYINTFKPIDNLPDRFVKLLGNHLANELAWRCIYEDITHKLSKFGKDDRIVAKRLLVVRPDCKIWDVCDDIINTVGKSIEVVKDLNRWSDLKVSKCPTLILLDGSDEEITRYEGINNIKNILEVNNEQ